MKNICFLGFLYSDRAKPYQVKSKINRNLFINDISIILLRKHYFSLLRTSETVVGMSFKIAVLKDFANITGKQSF